MKRSLLVTCLFGTALSGLVKHFTFYIISRSGRGLENCPQAKTSKSGQGCKSQAWQIGPGRAVQAQNFCGPGRAVFYINILRRFRRYSAIFLKEQGLTWKEIIIKFKKSFKNRDRNKIEHDRPGQTQDFSWAGPLRPKIFAGRAVTARDFSWAGPGRTVRPENLQPWKWTRYVLLFFSDASERRLSAESKILASTFERFRQNRWTSIKPWPFKFLCFVNCCVLLISFESFFILETEQNTVQSEYAITAGRTCYVLWTVSMSLSKMAHLKNRIIRWGSQSFFISNMYFDEE